MSTKPAAARSQPSDRREADAEVERARIVHWQRRTHAFAWACGMRIDRAVKTDED